MNRRTFITSGGALLASGCVTTAKGASSPTADDWALATRNRLTMTVGGLREPVKVWIAGDTHLGLHDARDAAFADCYRRMAQWPGDTQAFEKMLADAKAEGVDLLLLVGDQLSFPTLANVDFLLGALRRGGVPWRYVAGNHDWHFEGDGGSDPEQRARWIPRRLAALYPDGANPLCHSTLVKGVRFVMIDDSDYLITREQLDFWRAEAAKGDPTVLAMHIPIWTDGWDARSCLGAPTWGAAIDRYWQIERRERWPLRATPETAAFVESVLSTPNLVGVFTGHIHSFMAARRNGRHMFSVPENRKGARLEVTFRPQGA